MTSEKNGLPAKSNFSLTNGVTEDDSLQGQD